jgi:hypothetical protein
MTSPEGAGGILGNIASLAKKATGAACTPPAGAKLRRYRMQIELHVKAVNKDTAKKALADLIVKVPEWGPALMGMLGVGSQMKLVGLTGEVVSGKKARPPKP